MNTVNASKAAWIIVPLLLAGCATMSVSSQKYPQADFSGYRSYAWIAEDPLIRPSDTEPQISAVTARRIREAIESELAVKGYTGVASPEDADFVVAYTVGTRERIDAMSYPLPYRGPWRWSWYAAGTDLRVYREGTLSIDIFDGASKQPVWHGRARKEVTGADVSDPGPVIKQGVAAILKQFPSR